MNIMFNRESARELHATVGLQLLARAVTERSSRRLARYDTLRSSRRPARVTDTLSATVCAESCTGMADTNTDAALDKLAEMG